MKKLRFSLVAMALALRLPFGLHAATGCGAIKPDSTDAVASAPDHHKVILENDAVRVLEARVPLHSYEPPHTHPWPSVFFEQTSGLNEPWKTVNIRWSEGGPSKGFASSDRDRHNLLIEIKTVDCQPAPAADLPSTDAVKIHDPNISVVLENEYVRVLSVRHPTRRQRTVAHAHLAGRGCVFQFASLRAVFEGWHENSSSGAERNASDLRPQQPAAALGGKPGNRAISGVPRGVEAHARRSYFTFPVIHFWSSAAISKLFFSIMIM